MTAPSLVCPKCGGTPVYALERHALELDARGDLAGDGDQILHFSDAWLSLSFECSACGTLFQDATLRAFVLENI